MKALGTILMVVTGFFLNTRIERVKSIPDYTDRQTIAIITNAKGEVRKIGDEDIYMIYCKEKHLKLNAFDLPSKYKRNGRAITFSGNIKMMDAMEDEWGELFQVTNIK